MADVDPAVAAARREAPGLKGGAREWLKSKPAAVRGDREVVLAVVRRDGLALEHAAQALRSDREVVLAAVRKGAFALQHATPSLLGERDFILAAVQHNGYALACAPARFRSDREIVMTAVREEGSALEYATEKLRADRDIAMAAARWSEPALEYVARSLWSDRAFALAVAVQNGAAVEHLPPDLQDDHLFLLSVIERNGDAFRFAPPRWATDYDFALAAVRRNVAALEHVPAKLREDHGFLLAVAEVNWEVLERLPEELWQDETFVLAAVEQDGSSFKYASPSLRVRKDFVLQAVERCAAAFEHAVPKLRGDWDLALEAVALRAAVLAHVPTKLREDVKFALAAVQRNSSAAKHVTEALWSDRDFVLGMVELDCESFAMAAWALRVDRDFVLRVVGKRGLSLEHAAEGLRADREVLEAALSSDVRALGKASHELRSDPAVVLPVVDGRGCALQYAADELKANREVVLAAVRGDGEALAFASAELRGDRGFVLQAVEEDGAAFAHALPGLRADRLFVLQAVERQGHALQFADERLLLDEEFLFAAIRRNAAALGYVPAEQRASHGFVLSAVRTNAAALRFTPRKLQEDPSFIRASQNGYVEARGKSGDGCGSDSSSSLEDFFRFCELGELQGAGEVSDDEPEDIVRQPDKGAAAAGGDDDDDDFGGGFFDFGELDELQRCADAFAGEWEDEEGALIIIKGTTMQGPDGTPLDIQIMSQSTFACDFGVQECEAELTEDGKLVWSDGCTWTRRRLDAEHRDFPELEALSPAELRTQYRLLGLPAEPGMGPETRLARLKMAALWAKCPLLELVKACRDRRVPTAGVSQLASETDQRELLTRRLFTRECSEAWQALGIPVARFARMRDAAKVLKQIAHLERMRVSDLEAEHRKLGLPLDRVMQRRELEEPLRSVRIWRSLPLRELQHECEERGLPAREPGPGMAFEEERRRKLIDRLIRTLSADALDSRGIPLQRLASVEVGLKVSDEWDRLDKLGGRSLQEECATLDLPPEACLEWYGRGDLVARLKQLAVWQEFSLDELRAECSKRHVAVDKMQALHSEAQRQALLERLLVDLFADLYEEAPGSVPVRQLGSLKAATAVLQRWERLGGMSLAALLDEFKKLMGIRPQELEADELQKRLRQAAVWSEHRLPGLREECTKRGIPRNGSEGMEEQRERQALTEWLLQTLCGDVYGRCGIDLRIFGSLSAASGLLERWEHVDQLSAMDVTAEYKRLGLPDPANPSKADLRGRLRSLAKWRAMPFRSLQDECWSMGLRSSCNMGHFVSGQQHEEQGSLYYRSFKEIRGDKDRLVQEIVAAAWDHAGQSEDQPPPPPTGPPPPEFFEQEFGRSREGASRPQRAPPGPPARPAKVVEHLQTLGLPADAALEEVKKAYRQLALKHHPDKNPDASRESATQLFQELGEAYEALLVFLKDSG